MIKKILQEVAHPLYLAPMEDITDMSFRKICKEMGADFLISEFVSSEALIRDAEKSIKKLSFDITERPFGIQIFGHDEHSLSQAAEIAADSHPDFIDINWGCPVKKVVTKGAGAAILQDIPKMVRLTEAVVKRVNIPVTVKTRLGWDMSNTPIVTAAEQLQDIGIDAIAIHGRTRSQFYSGTADWRLIAEVKNNRRMHIPVIGNGDVDSYEKAKQLQEMSGVDALMIGRAAIGNPWIFKEIKGGFLNLNLSTPTYEERVAVCLRHLTEAIEVKGERRAVLEMRKHYSGYFKAIPHFKEKKIKLMLAQSFDEIATVLS